MTEMIHKLHSKLQRLIVVENQATSIYDLAKQCQRIYEGGLQADKTERVANRIDQQRQRRLATPLMGSTSFFNFIYLLKIQYCIDLYRNFSVD